MQRAASTIALLAVAVWFGGLAALGAIVAPIVFSRVSFPSNADAMLLVFRRFDLVAMSCAAVLLASEAARAAVRPPFVAVDHARAGVSVLAAVLAVFEGTHVSARIAELHSAGAVRGLGSDGAELSRLHDWAEWGAMTQLGLLAAVIVFHVLALSSIGGPGRFAALASGGDGQKLRSPRATEGAKSG
jgi:putative copper export protein